MKNKLFTAIAVAGVALTLTLSSGLAAEDSAATADLKALVTKVQAKLKDGKPTEAELAPELKEFDALLTKYKADKSDEVAQILLMKAMLYKQVLKDDTKGDAEMARLKRDFPDSKPVAMLKQQEASEKIQAGLHEGAVFPEFSEKDLAGKPLSVAGYKGKVVLIDFWATWCGPCVQELPNVLKAYTKFHPQGFEIIGISLDSNRQKLESFIKEKNMTWPQYFDGKGWQNKLATKYGVQSIPATYLLDGNGKIIGSNLRGPELEAALDKALAKK